MRVFISSLLCILLFSCNSSKQEPKIVSKHSNGFNTSVQNAMDQYHSLTESFVNWDSNAVVSKSNEVKNSLDNIKLDEFKAEVKQTANNSGGAARQSPKSGGFTSPLTVRVKHYSLRVEEAISTGLSA